MSQKAIRFDCAECSGSIRVTFLSPGEQAKCPHCGALNTVPASDRAPKLPESHFGPIQEPTGPTTIAQACDPSKAALWLIAVGVLLTVFQFGFRLESISFQTSLIGRILLFRGLWQWRAIGGTSRVIVAALCLVAMGWLMDAATIFGLYVWFMPFPLLEVLLVLLVLQGGCRTRDSLAHLDRALLIVITLQSILLAAACVLTFSAPALNWMLDTLSRSGLFSQQVLYTGAFLPVMLLGVIATTAFLVIIVAMLLALRKERREGQGPISPHTTTQTQSGPQGS